jgi:hypothetical protein
LVFGGSTEINKSSLVSNLYNAKSRELEPRVFRCYAAPAVRVIVFTFRLTIDHHHHQMPADSCQ